MTGEGWFLLVMLGQVWAGHCYCVPFKVACSVHPDKDCLCSMFDLD